MLGLKSLPFLEVVAFAIHSFATMNHLGESFLPGLLEDGIKRLLPITIAMVIKEAKEEGSFEKTEDQGQEK